jgi:hypothetical protein
MAKVSENGQGKPCIRKQEMIVDSPRDIAYEINNQLRLGMTPRPWQMYEPAETLWWLVPSTDWPAYRHGKFIFSLAKDSPRKALVGLNDSLIEANKIFAGLNVEKGYGHVATEVDTTLKRKTAQIIDSDWLWFTLVEGNGPARFSKLLAAVSAVETLHLYVVSSYVHDRESAVQPERDAVMFSCHSAGISAVLHNHFPIGVLPGIRKATNFATLADHLKTIDDFHWVDIYVGTYLAKGNIDIKEFYQRVLLNFNEWVVEAPAKAKDKMPAKKRAGQRGRRL